MKYCTVCQAVLQKNTTTGSIIFKCICGSEYKKDPTDTLMAEEILITEQSSSKFSDFMSNAAFDKSGYKISKMCHECKLDYLTMIIINNSTIYTCTCGFNSTKIAYDSRTNTLEKIK